MGTFCRLRFLRFGRDGRVAGHALYRVALVCMLMGALGHFRIAIVRMFMGAGRSRRLLGVAALAVMLGVMFA